MKKNITLFSAVILLAGSSIFTSCKKDDVTAPVVTLNGGDETISLQGNFVDAGATAHDNKDGDIAPSVSGSVDVNNTGVYQLVYTATDAAGNSASATRNVTVVNDLESMTGVYSCTLNPGAYTYTQTVTASSTTNRRLIFGKFGDYDNNDGIYADVANNTSTSTINLPLQTAVQVGTPATDRTFSGTGARSASPLGFGLQYTETTQAGSSTFTEVYVKQ